MAFRLNISACLNNCCEELVVSDVSGIQSKLENLILGTDASGWGTASSSNPKTANATAATITITSPLGVSTVTDVLTEVNAYDTTNNTSYLEFSPISPTGDKFSDGLYTITYNVTVNGLDYSSSIQQLFSCNAQCCVDNMWSQLPDHYQLDTYDEWVDRCTKAEVLLKMLKSSANCSNTNAISEILDSLEDICDYNNCNCNS